MAIQSAMSQLPAGKYEKIFGHSEARIGQGGTHVVRNGELVPGHVMKNDAHNLRSLGMGVGIDQIPEATKLYKGKGVTFDPATGDAIFSDRKARLMHMRDRGYYDKDEVRG